MTATRELRRWTVWRVRLGGSVGEWRAEQHPTSGLMRGAYGEPEEVEVMSVAESEAVTAERDRYRAALEHLRDMAAEGGNLDDGLWCRRFEKVLRDA